MANEADVTFQNNTFVFTGELDFSSVMFVYQKSLLHLNKCDEAVFDFSQLKKGNSSVLALIVELINLAKQSNKRISFKSIPNNLMSIAKVGGLDRVIP